MTSRNQVFNLSKNGGEGVQDAQIPRHTFYLQKSGYEGKLLEFKN